MSDSSHNLEKKMLKTYLKNMEYLKKYENALFTRVENLSTQLENGVEEEYTLDFTEDRLNVLDIKTNSYLYESDPIYDAQYKCSKFYPNSNEAISLIKSKKIERNRDPKYKVDSFKFINEYIDKMEKNSAEYTVFSEIGKYIFIGTLLGIHIAQLHKKIKAKNYLILENSLELFRISLFFCNYKKIAATSKLFFIVEEKPLNIRDTLRRFLKNQSKYNHIFKYSIASSKYNADFQTLSEIITLENPLLYTFSDYLGAYGRGIEYIHKEYKILNFTSVDKVFNNKPALYIGPGPSLSEHIKFIKKAKDKFVLICLASTLKLLSEHDIVPDIIISIDASTIIRKQFDVPKKYYCDSILLISSKIDGQIIKKLKKDNIYMVQDSIEFFEGFGILRGNSSGEIGYSLCCYFNIKELYLIGMDVALNQKTKSTHDESYYVNQEIDSNEHSFFSHGELDFDKDMIKVKGNFCDEVYTTRRYLQLIFNYNQISQNNTANMKVYNLSNGAYLEHTLPLKSKKIKLDNFKTIKKKKLKSKMSKHFDEYSKNYFTPKEMEELTIELNLAKQLLHILNKCIKKDEKRIFDKSFESQNKSSFVIQIINLYYDLLNPYKNILEQKKKKNSQKLNMLQLIQLKQILEFYICKLQIK